MDKEYKITNINEIQKELDSISELINVARNQLPTFLIKEKDDFLKTNSYKQLRKGLLSNEQISFIFYRYSFNSVDLFETIVNKIKDLTLSKAIEIGLINYLLRKRSSFASDIHTMEAIVFDAIKIEDYEKDLKILIDVFKNRKAQSKSFRYELDTFNLFLAHSWIVVRDNINKSVNIEHLELIRAHYNDIFYLNSDQDYKSNVFIPVQHGHTTLANIISVRNEAYKIIVTLYKCPFIDFDFAYNLLSSNETIISNANVFISSLLTVLSSPSLDPTIDFDYALFVVKKAHNLIGTPYPIHSFLREGVSQNEASFNDFIQHILDIKLLTEEKKKEIYSLFIKDLNISYIYNGFSEALRLMVAFDMTDEEIANFIKSNKSVGEHAYNIKRVYSCTPSDKKSYPKKKTLLEIIKIELDSINENPLNVRGNANAGDDILFEEYYIKHKFRLSNDAVITWKMANSVKFLKDILMNSHCTPVRINKIVASMNLKSIGFKRYSVILEDRARVLDMNDFSAISKNALKYATKMELYMYKNKIGRHIILSSPFVDFKTIAYFLNKREVPSEIEGYNRSEPGLINIIEKNNNISKKERIDLIMKLNNSNSISICSLCRRSANYSNRHDEKMSIMLRSPKDQTLTISDFNQYYNSKECE